MKAPEVLEILSEKCRVKHLSYATEKSYRSWAQSYIRALPKYPTAWPSEKKAEAFLTGLAQRDVAGGDAESGAKCHCLSLQGRPRDAAGDGGCAASEAACDGARSVERG